MSGDTLSILGYFACVGIFLVLLVVIALCVAAAHGDRQQAEPFDTHQSGRW